MPFWFPPPPPFVSGTGAQPYAPNKLPPSTETVPNPPFSHPGRTAAVMATIVALAQPNPWTYDYAGGGGNGQQPYGPRQNPPSTLIVPNPPFVHQARQATQQSIVQIAWQPSYVPWAFVYNNGGLGRQPYGPPTAPPSTLIVPNPPFVHQARQVGNQATIVAAWQPPDPQPQQKRPSQILSVDSSPGVGVPRIVILNDDPLPQRGAMIAALIPTPSIPFSPPLTAILAAWQPIAPQPQQDILLSPSIPGQSVDNPPFVYEGIGQTTAAIIQAWQPAAPPPQQLRPLSPGIPGQSVDPPPPRQITILIPPLPDPAIQQPRYGVVQVQVSASQPEPPPWFNAVSAWQSAAPWPQQRAPVVTASAVVDNPPGMGIPRIVVIDDPPLPQTAAKIAPLLPQAAQVDNPPFGRRQFQGWGWGPPVVVDIFGGQLILSVDNPPFSHHGRDIWVTSVIQAWQTPAPPPQIIQYVVQPGAATPDNPPFRSSLAVTLEIIQAWQPPPPWPQQRIIDFTPSAAADAPPGVGVPHVVWVDDWPLPQTSPKLVQPFVAAAANVPPPPLWLNTVLMAWRAPDPWPQQKLNLNPALELVPNPPFRVSLAVTLGEVVQAWQPPDPLPQVQHYVVQPGIAVIYVPYAPVWFTAIEAWQPPPPQPQQARYLPASTLLVPNPPFGSTSQVARGAEVWWTPPDPWPQQKINLPPSTLIVPNPPFRVSVAVTLGETIQAWQPPAPWPQQARYLPASTLLVPNPPFRVSLSEVLAEVIGTWQPPPPWPQQFRPLTPGVPGQSVDRPPLGFPAYVARGAETAWQPPDPWPQQFRPLSPGVPGQSTDQPPSIAAALKIAASIITAWQPPPPWPQQKVNYAPNFAAPLPPPPKDFTAHDPVFQWWAPPPPQAPVGYRSVVPGFFSGVLRPTVIAYAQPRDRTAEDQRRERIAYAEPRTRTVTWNPAMSKATNNLWPPQDSGIEQETVGFDFGPALGAGVTLLSVVSITVQVIPQLSTAQDPAPQTRLLGPPQIIASARTKAPSAQVAQLFGNTVDAVIYRLTCVVTTSDNQQLSLWTHFASKNPN